MKTKKTRTKSTKRQASKKPVPQLKTHVKFKFRKHIFPPLVGLIIAFLVFGFFNSQLLSAQISYYLESSKLSSQNLDQQTINAPIDKTAPPKITINTINVSAPVIFEPRNSESSFQQDLLHGVVHYPQTAVPGQQGNVVIFGHSSGQWWAPGDYKFVFTLLNKVRIGDKVFIDYQGTRYIYKVYDISVVDPTNLSVLNQSSGYNLTLITCTPVGTSSQRLIVRAQQYLPNVTNDVNSAEAASLPAGAEGALPSNSSSFWHDLKQLFQ